MSLYVVQHAKSVEKEVDSEGPLSAEGMQDMGRVRGLLDRGEDGKWAVEWMVMPEILG